MSRLKPLPLKVDAATFFYPITDNLNDLRVLSQLGCEWIQFRHKDASKQLALEALSIWQESRKRRAQMLFLNDRIDWALDLGFPGVHLGQEDIAALSLPEKRQLSQLSVGISTHTVDEMNCALSLRPNYVAVGPLFTSSTKVQRPALKASLRSSLHLRAAMLGIPVVAIGGIGLGELTRVASWGFNKAASIAFARKVANSGSLFLF